MEWWMLLLGWGSVAVIFGVSWYTRMVEIRTRLESLRDIPEKQTAPKWVYTQTLPTANDARRIRNALREEPPKQQYENYPAYPDTERKENGTTQR